MPVNVIAGSFVPQPGCIRQEKSVQLHWKNIGRPPLVEWATLANSRRPSYFISARTCARWNAWSTKRISSQRLIIIWIGSKVVLWWPTLRGTTTQRQVPMALEAMELRKKVAFGWKPQSMKKPIMWSKSMISMSVARKEEMKDMDYGENPFSFN